MQKSSSGEKLFQANGAEVIEHTKKGGWGMKLCPKSHTLYKKINSKWITDFNVKCKATKLGEESTEENLEDLEKKKYVKHA